MTISIYIGPKASGLCVCKLEPMGDNGLEGYVSGVSYKCEHMASDRNGYPYFRVYPCVAFPDYYETCSESTFYEYFEITEASSL